jgi:hypothetical protein
MIVQCSEKEKKLDASQIDRLFSKVNGAVESPISQGVLPQIQQVSIETEKESIESRPFLPLFLLFFYTAAVVLICISIFKNQNKPPIMYYEKRCALIEQQLDNVLCNVFFSCIRASHRGETDDISATLMSIKIKFEHLKIYFSDFLDKYFDITLEQRNLLNKKQTSIQVKNDNGETFSANLREQVQQQIKGKLQDFYWDDDSDIILEFICQDFSKAEKKARRLSSDGQENNGIMKRILLKMGSNSKNNTISDIDNAESRISADGRKNVEVLRFKKFDKKCIMKVLLPDSSESLKKESLEELLPLELYKEQHMDTLPIADRIARKLALSSAFVELPVGSFTKGSNENKNFLSFLLSLVEIDESRVQKFLAVD